MIVHLKITFSHVMKFGPRHPGAEPITPEKVLEMYKDQWKDEPVACLDDLFDSENIECTVEIAGVEEDDCENF